MDREKREYVLMCEHTSGDVWSPERLYAIDGSDDRIVRCRDCAHHEPESDRTVRCTLLEAVMFACDFCSCATPGEVG